MPPLTRPIEDMPEFIHDALLCAQLEDAYRARPPYQRNDYLRWIKRAKREETRQKRLAQMLDELRLGTRYMNMPHTPRKQKANTPPPF